MAEVTKTRVCPETGKTLIRDVRAVEFSYKGHSIVLEQSGWFATDGGEESLHSGEDMLATQDAFDEFKARVDGILTGAEVQTIRRRLKLSQREAGVLLGGGPRSFQKYESGETRPSVAMSNLLRLLERDPSRVEELRSHLEADVQPIAG